MPRKILIVKPSSLGDIVHSLPFLDALHDTFPQAEMHWIVAKGLEGLLENHPMVKRLWVINKDRWKNLRKVNETVAEFKTLFNALRDERFDITIDLQGLLRSGVLTKASRAPIRVGFKEAREGSFLFYTHRVRGGRDIHAVDRYLKLAAALGAETGEVRFPLPLIKESEQVQKLKKENGRYAVIVSGARWKTKQWPAEKFGRLAALLDERSIVIGSPADAEISGEIERLSNGKAVSAAGKTDIRELISIIRDARYVITNDSGPMHIAAAFGIPVVALFGPTNPVRTGPYGEKNILLTPGIPCAPCYKRNCKTMKCMKAITVEKVHKAIKEILHEISGR